MAKRPATDAPTFEQLEFMPLGGGEEVGRSCLILRYRGKTIMLDCGVLPAFRSYACLPLLDAIDPAEIDIVFITHFHLDHAAALPHFTQKLVGFRGRIFATHATITCMRLMLLDYIRVAGIEGGGADGGGAGGGRGQPAQARRGGGASAAASLTAPSGAPEPEDLYDAADLEACLKRIEVADFRQRISVEGVSFMFYNAGHVLGAAMVQIEIGGLRVLYTGDYSCEEDRHLMAADTPVDSPPNVLVVESTFGMQVHESREEREGKFVRAVESVVKAGGRCLVPVFAVGRSQELLLILDEYWAAHPELQSVPIFIASKVARQSIEVYKALTSVMSARIQAKVGERNPWDFRFVRPWVGGRGMPDGGLGGGPCVVLASPGLMQSGLSRELFEKWCDNPRNGVVLTGFSSEGSLARQLELNPREVEALDKRMLTVRCRIERVSFAAHADSKQTFKFLDDLQPPTCILVHGERSEMRRLRVGLANRFRSSAAFQVFTPPNGARLTIDHVEKRFAKAVGAIASRRVNAGPGAVVVSGLLLQRNFEYTLVAPEDLPKFSQISTHTLMQKLHVPFRSTFGLLSSFVRAMYSDTVEGTEAPPAPATATTTTDPASAAGGAFAVSGGFAVPPPQRPRRLLRVSGGLVTVTHAPPDRVILTWSSAPLADMVADSLVAVISQADVSPSAVRALHIPCSGHAPHGSGGGSSADASHAHGRVEVSSAEGSSLPPDDDVFDGEDDPGAGAAVSASFVRALAQAAPWARELMDSDSGPTAAALAETCAASAPTSDGAGDGAAQKGSAGLPGPALRRRDFLLRVFVDQYGPGNVVYRGPDALQVADGVPGLRSALYEPPLSEAECEGASDGSSGAPLAPPACAVDVFVDGTVARIVYGTSSAAEADKLAPGPSLLPCWHVVESSVSGLTGSYTAAVNSALGIRPVHAVTGNSVEDGKLPQPPPVAGGSAAPAAVPAWTIGVSGSSGADEGEGEGQGEEGTGSEALLLPLRPADPRVAASLTRSVALADALFLPA